MIGNFLQLRHWWSAHALTFQKVLISAFLVAYYAITAINISPNAEGPLLARLRENTHTISDFFGWSQNWRLFGPNIRTTNFHSFGLIGYQDGTIGSWEPPRFDRMNFVQKYCKDKFHKWDGDCIPWYNYHNFWPDLARYVGRLHYDRSNTPVWFMLLRFESDIPDPRQGPIITPERMPAHTRLLNSFLYHYRAEDFR